MWVGYHRAPDVYMYLYIGMYIYIYTYISTAGRLQPGPRCSKDKDIDSNKDSNKEEGKEEEDTCCKAHRQEADMQHTCSAGKQTCNTHALQGNRHTAHMQCESQVPSGCILCAFLNSTLVPRRKPMKKNRGSCPLTGHRVLCRHAAE